MDKKELIKELNNEESGKNTNINRANGIRFAISLINQLEPTISEVKEYCDTLDNSCNSCNGCDIPLVDECCHTQQTPDKWNIKEITKAIKGEK